MTPQVTRHDQPVKSSKNDQDNNPVARGGRNQHQTKEHHCENEEYKGNAAIAQLASPRHRGFVCPPGFLGQALPLTKVIDERVKDEHADCDNGTTAATNPRYGGMPLIRLRPGR